MSPLSKNTDSVAFLGPAGTFTEAAARKHFPTAGKVEFEACSSIDEVFSRVENGSSTYGVVPVENSTEGAINNTQDCLVDTSATIVGEEIIAVQHNLLAHPAFIEKDLSKAKVRRVLSHKQSLAQCRQWLKVNLPGLEQQEVASNAKAALEVSQDGDSLAIAGLGAAETYGLKVLASNIQDQDNNSTRFLILSKGSTQPGELDKTSLVVYTDNKPGALFKVLAPFEHLQISLTKIETRPSRKEAWEYVFFIDFEGHSEDERTKELYSRLQKCTAEVKILGSYPVAN